MPKTEKRQMSEPAVETFKERLSNELQRKKALGITQKDLAIIAGIAQNTISTWKNEKNTVMPSIFELSKLAKVLGVNVEYLAGMTTERDPNTTLEATGLSTQALQNLIEAEQKYPNVSSRIIASKHFFDLIEYFFFLWNHADFVAYLTKCSKDPDMPSRRKDLYRKYDELRFEKYAVTEAALDMLNDVTSIDEILDEAKTALDGYNPSNDVSVYRKENDHGEKTK